MKNKELLMVDLCARLPYNVYVDRIGIPHKLIGVNSADKTVTINNKDYMPTTFFINASEIPVKPYLRPMSSMTKEEKKDLLDTVVGKNGAEYFQVLPDGSIDNNDSAHQDLSNFNIHWVNFDGVNTSAYIDWLNAHHFDFRNLIGKGLAIEVTEDNNPYK